MTSDSSAATSDNEKQRPNLAAKAWPSVSAAPSSAAAASPPVRLTTGQQNSNGNVTAEVVRLKELGGAEQALWQTFRKQRPYFSSPFMSLEFLQQAQNVGRAVEIAVLRREQEICGFLPFERRGKRGAVPAAARMNDVHGVLGCDLNRQQLLSVMQQCHLDTFAFHAWFGSSEGIRPFSFSKIQSYMADLEQCGSYGSYAEYLKHERYTLKQQVRRTRKWERDLGPVRLEFRSLDARLLELLFQWKREQFQRTNTFDIFSVPWTTDLVRSLFKTPATSRVQGVLSVLYSGDKPAAMHVGIQEGKLLHYWFPVYQLDYRQYSPGAEMFLQIAEHCQSVEGLRKIDLGYGEQPYKHKLINQTSDCYCGLISRRAVPYYCHSMAYHAHQRFRSWSFKEPVKSVFRRCFPGFGRQGF